MRGAALGRGKATFRRACACVPARVRLRACACSCVRLRACACACVPAPNKGTQTDKRDGAKLGLTRSPYRRFKGPLIRFSEGEVGPGDPVGPCRPPTGPPPPRKHGPPAGPPPRAQDLERAVAAGAECARDADLLASEAVR